MLYRYQYVDEESKQNIINANKGKFPIEDQIFFDSNFLIFSDEPRLEERLSEIEDTQDIILLKLEGVIA